MRGPVPMVAVNPMGGVGKSWQQVSTARCPFDGPAHMVEVQMSQQDVGNVGFSVTRLLN